LLEYLIKKNYSKETKTIIENLSTKLDKCIEKMKIKNSDQPLAFIRLNTRSPKDAISNYPNKIEKALGKFMLEPFNTMNLMDEKGNLLQNKNDEYYSSQNNALIEIRKLITTGKNSNIKQGLCVKSSEEALFLFKKSERVIQDLQYTLDHPKHWNMGIIVRFFDRRVNLENEFRCFVSNNKITAISQYDKQVINKINKMKKVLF
jgi:hypothetical protein